MVEIPLTYGGTARYFVQSAPMELNLLALETSSSRCGVALLRASGDRLEVSVREHEGSQEHAERLLPMANELLAQAGLPPGCLLYTSDAADE